MKKIKRYLQQQGWYLESKSLYDGKATLLGGNLLEGKMNLKKTVVFLIVCITFFSCDKFLEESPRDKLPEDEVYNNISDVYLNAVASLTPTSAVIATVRDCRGRVGESMT